MLNFLLAIIIDAYTSVKDDIQVLSARLAAREVLEGRTAGSEPKPVFLQSTFYGSEQPIEQPARYTTCPPQGG